MAIQRQLQVLLGNCLKELEGKRKAGCPSDLPFTRQNAYPRRRASVNRNCLGLAAKCQPESEFPCICRSRRVWAFLYVYPSAAPIKTKPVSVCRSHFTRFSGQAEIFAFFGIPLAKHLKRIVEGIGVYLGNKVVRVKGLRFWLLVRAMLAI